MLTRIFYSITLLPIALGLIYGGIWLNAMLFFLSAIAIIELTKAFFKKCFPITYINIGLLFVYYFFIEHRLLLAFFLIIALCNLLYLVINHEKITPVEVIINLFAFFYIGILLSTVYLVWDINRYMAWLIFILAWGCDTFAYFSGKFFGKHKLIETLSPKKTIEGFVGGILGATALSFLFVYIIEVYFTTFDIGYFYLAALFIITSMLAQFGDLTASAIKRYVNIKDYGTLIPGHGGILDRFDSILFTAPIIYIFLKLLERAC